MSIAAFYRTEIPMTTVWSYLEDGYAQKSYSPIQYMKGNVQPWKEGEKLVNPAGGVYFSEYSIVYLKEFPEFEPPTLSPGAQDLQQGQTYIYVDDRWNTVLGKQNWRRAGRGPKHWKMQIAAVPNQSTTEIPTPETSIRTVEAFQNETYELEQVINTLNEGVF